MLRVRIRSRVGNIVLGTLGVLYVIAGAVLLAWSIVQTWDAASLMDRALQIILIAAIAAGLWFTAMARVNLNERELSPQPARQHRASAAALT